MYFFFNLVDWRLVLSSLTVLNNHSFDFRWRFLIIALVFEQLISLLNLTLDRYSSALVVELGETWLTLRFWKSCWIIAKPLVFEVSNWIYSLCPRKLRRFWNYIASSSVIFLLAFTLLIFIIFGLLIGIFF
jgi:hypothetical protein